MSEHERRRRATKHPPEPDTRAQRRRAEPCQRLPTPRIKAISHGAE